jgi:hypothetical protein
MIPLAEQIACVRREVALRERIYPRLVRDGKLRRDEADRELARMRAVLETLEAAAAE